MPLREGNRDQGLLLPPSWDDLVEAGHSVRYVASFIDGLGAADWRRVGIRPEGAENGRPAYAPRVVLAVWVYGFMIGIRSCRKLEAACREQVPFLWLTANQHPDHNTLWRFYQQHREGMQELLRLSVRTAAQGGMVDLALQAVDGTKVEANAANRRTLNERGLLQLLARLDKAVMEALSDLEAQNRTGGQAAPARLPKELQQADRLRARVGEVLETMRREGGPERRNLTDEDARFMKGRRGVTNSYNAQAVVSELNPEQAGGSGYLITAVDVVTEANDSGQLAPMLDAAADTLGQRVPVTLADAGYHSGPSLVEAARRGQQVIIPEPQSRLLTDPYRREAFTYDPVSDSYTCPLGEHLRFTGTKRRSDRSLGRDYRIYRTERGVCRRCPAFGTCTRDERNGRALEVPPEEGELRRHRAWMRTEVAQRLYARRKHVVEPVFGLLKEQQGARRFLLRTLGKVRAEWSLLATAFNLRTLAKAWRHQLAA